MNVEDFEEEEVWDIAVRESPRYEQDPSLPTMKNLMVSSSSSTPRNIPRRASSQTTTNEPASKGAQLQQSSAPMNIPDWSKIYGKRNGEDYHDHHGDYHDDDHHHDYHVDGGDDDGMMPPHEWIARKLARSQISSFSVCEGIGRTLKGRDLSKVRNAILTKTGFLE